VDPFPDRDLEAYVGSRRTGTALAAWPPEVYDGLVAVARHADELLDRVTRTCLVHGDLNPKNLLVDPASLEVTGVLDWEFAHAGVPGTDLGNLLGFERDPVLTEAVLASYCEAVPDAGATPPVQVLDRARAADLMALVELAARRGENPVTERAHRLLVTVAGSGDLHAAG
jgi:Ser/Thr protein kinase RdoA (MazF antagonist)